MKTRTQRPLNDSTRAETPQPRLPGDPGWNHASGFPLLRSLTAIAPSGAEICFRKFTESPNPELSWYQGNLTIEESQVFWKAKLRAERQGAAMWDKARAVLITAGWTITEA